MKKNSIDLNNVRPQCESIRDEIVKVNKKIYDLKIEYEVYNKKLLLSKQESGDKSDLGYELYRLNIHAISLIQELAMCEEGRDIHEHV